MAISQSAISRFIVDVCKNVCRDSSQVTFIGFLYSSNKHTAFIRIISPIIRVTLVCTLLHSAWVQFTPLPSGAQPVGGVLEGTCIEGSGS